MIAIQSKIKLEGSRLTKPKSIVLTVVAISLLISFLYSLPAAEEKKTSGDISFVDSKGAYLEEVLEIGAVGVPRGHGHKSINKISWTNLQELMIHFMALETKNVSIDLMISGDSHRGRMVVEHYGAFEPKGVNISGLGYPVKFFEISTERISFSEANITIQYTDDELKGLNESNLAIYRYDSDAVKWDELPTQVDTANNLLNTNVNSLPSSLSIFAVSIGDNKIEIIDSNKNSLTTNIKTFDEAKTLKKKKDNADTLSVSDISEKGEIEVDALSEKHVAIKLKIEKTGGGKVILDNFGKKNPVSVPLPGKAVKYVEIGASGISFSSAEVTIRYSEAELEGADERTLVIYHWKGAAWEALTTVVDTANNTLTAAATSLSPFGVSATGGIKKIQVQTNRYSLTGFNNATVALAGYDSDNSSFTFTGGALVIGADGLPVSGENVFFEIRSAAGTLKANGTKVTGTNGLVLFSDNTSGDFISDTDTDYGTWTVKAWLVSNTSINDTVAVNITIANYLASCSKGYCHHNPNDINNAGSTQTSPRSPYSDKFGISGTGFSMAAGAHIGHGHGTPCVQCHSGYGTSADRTVDNHSIFTCEDANCHGTFGASWPIPIPSCYNANCHPLYNRNLTNITTLANISGIGNTTIYSTTTKDGAIGNNSNVTAYSVHNGSQYSNTTGVPCWICHGPMHNITKPDPSPANKNNITEYTQCTTCHNAYQRHNNSVNCTVCHSQDAHIIKVFAQNATYINESTSPFRGNCTNCHQNSTFFNILLAQPKAGYHNNTSLPPPLITNPVQHSNDPSAGRKWNTTTGYYTQGENGSAQLSSCKYCHGETMHKTSALGRPSLWDGNNTVNSTIGNTTWCAGCHWQGYANASSTYNDMVNNFTNDSLAIPPEITGNSTYANQSIYEYTNHSLYSKNDSTCNRCHGYRYGFTTITQLIHNQTRVGGANCVDCHDIGGIALLSRVNVTATNDSSAIHKNLNSNATVSNGTAYYSNNKRCWACHGNGTEPSEPNAHPTRYKMPYNCTDCHIQSPGQNFNYTPNFTLLNVTQHYWNGTNITTTNATSCYACHNRSEMMVGLNLDPDGAASVYNGANGGNNSTSHYGRKRTDLANLNITSYCSYCHNNATNNVTFYVSDFNNSILNHTSRATTPQCSDSTCHSSGRLHNATLAKPVSNDSLCIVCHGTGGMASTNNRSRHKSLNCTECHANSSAGTLAGKDIHAIKYLLQNNTFSTSNDSSIVVNCVTCHQTSSVDSSLGSFSAFKIPSPLHHSNSASNGSVWGNYWTNTTPLTACIYCHNDTRHNATPLGRILLWAPGYVLYGGIGTNTSCSNCHYRGDSNYTLMNSTFANATLPTPPEITNGTNWNGTGSDYYNHSFSSYTDQDCRNCHGSLLSASANMSEFQHNVAVGVAGGNNCTNCHNTGGNAGTGRLVNFTGMNDSLAIHRNLNSNDTSNITLPGENRKCWACHGNGSDPGNQHPTNYKTPYNCTDCHVTRQNLNFTPNNTLLNVTQHYWNGTNITTTNATSCYACHNRSEMMVGLNLDPDGSASVYNGANGGNNSTSHYGRKRTDLVSLNITSYCSYCHNNATNNVTFYVSDFNNSILNHTSRATTPQCSDSTCHSSGRLHNATLAKPVSNDSLCIVCHGTGGMASTNNRSRHKSLNCTECHANSSAGTLAGKDIHAIKYLLQNNTFSTSNDSSIVVNCVTCHQTSSVDSSLGSFSAFKIPSPLHHSNSASNGSVWGNYWTNTTPLTACIYCHNDTRHNATPLGRILLWAPGYVLYGGIGTNTSCSNCHYRGDSNYTLMNSTFANATLPTPPEITNGTNWKGTSSTYYNHTLDTYTDTTCRNCHGTLLGGTANMSEFLHNAATGTAGGANCTNCHNIGGTAGTGKLVNFTAMNDTSAIHRNLNINAAISDPNYSVNRKCWACHGNGSEPGNSHPTNYKSPYNCTNCHVQGIGQNFNYTPNNTILNVTQHYWNGTNISTPAATSCYSCHNRSEMMLGISLDPDGNGTVYGGANGGNNSTSHYGKNRTDLRTWNSGQSVNCSYCHQNQSTAFAVAMANSGYNSTIANHSRSNSPTCYNSTCHNTGWLHNSMLSRPTLQLPNSTYCQNCHASKQKHNDTLDCSNCHINSTGNDTIHPIKYVQRNGSFITSNVSAANCTNCHQAGLGGFSNATKIPTPLYHSNDPYSGGKWGNYWNNNSIITACYYCHQNDTHKAGVSLLGNVSFIKGSNTYKNSNLSDSTWCANCHYAAALQYNGSNLTPTPPEITNSSLNASDGTSFFNHSGFANYNDSTCKNCHGAIMSGYSETTLNFSHSVGEGGGGPDCISCHDTGGSGAPENKRIKASFIDQGVHKNLNNNATNSTSIDPINKACWACHGEGTEPSGHPARYKTPRECSSNDCHSLSQYFKAPMVYSHFKDADLNSNPGNVTTVNISTNASCELCHSNSLNAEGGTLNASVSHYATTLNLIDTINCIYCHLNRDNSIKWGNATEINKNRSVLIEMYKDNNKFTAYTGDFVDLGLGYRLKVTGISDKRESATIELYKGNNLIDTGLVNVGRYVYEETRIIDNASSRIPVIVLNVTEMFVSDDKGFIQFEGFRLKRLHTENKTTSCYKCHHNVDAEKHKYTVIDRVDDNVFYTEVLFNSSGKNEYDQQQALQILANKTPNDAHVDIERAKRKIIRAGETWKLAGNYSLTLTGVTVNSDSASFLLKAGGKDQTAIARRGETLVFELSINYLGYTDTKITIFRANVPEISQNIVVLDDIVALSPEIIKTNVNSTIYGYNASWLWKNNTFLTGGIPEDMHSPLLRDGVDGGAACISCHNVGELGVHSGLNKGAIGNVASANKVCWACHGDGSEPKWHPATYKNPRECKSCHAERGMTFNATYIGDENHSALVNCNQCHVEDTHKIKRFNVAPGIRRLSVSKQSVNAGEKITVNATAVAGYEMRIRGVEYYIDSPDARMPMTAVDGSFDRQIEEVTAKINTSGLQPGNHIIYARAMERNNKWGPESSISITIEGKLLFIDKITEKVQTIINTPLRQILELKSHRQGVIIIALVLFGFALYKLRIYKKAKEVYDEAIKIKPEYTDNWYSRGLDLQEQGKYEEAIKAYDKAIEINPENADAWNNEGFALYKLGKYEEAEKAYEKAIEIMHRM